MDKLTDMLSSFFVSKRGGGHEVSGVTMGVGGVVYKPKQIITRSTSKSTESTESAESAESTETTESTESTSSRNSRNSKTVKSKSDSQDRHSEKTFSSNDSDTLSLDSHVKNNEEQEQRQVQEEQEEQVQVNGEELKGGDKQVKGNNASIPKKYILRAIDMSKKNIFIVNFEREANTITLSDLLHSFSLMNNVEEVYENATYIITANENKKMFRKMLLDNPYLYFTNFSIKQTLNKQTVDEIDARTKRTIVILDGDTLDSEVVNKYIEILGRIKSPNNVQFIILDTRYNEDVVDRYKLLTKPSKILIHRHEKTKNMQKTFYNNILRHIIRKEDKTSFQKYFDNFNRDTFGVKYIIVKDDELRYY